MRILGCLDGTNGERSGADVFRNESLAIALTVIDVGPRGISTGCENASEASDASPAGHG